MPGKVFIEEHLERYLTELGKSQLYIPGVVIGQVIDDNYYVVHLAAVTSWDEDTKDNKANVLAYKNLTQLVANSDQIFQKSLEVFGLYFQYSRKLRLWSCEIDYTFNSRIVNLLPGGSHVLGLFFIIPQDIKSKQPINIDFYEFNQQLNEHLLFNEKNKTWDYLLLNYSPVNKKSFCYTVDFCNSSGPEKTTYKSINNVYGSFDNDWVTLVGTFNFGALDRLNIAGGSKALFSVRKNLLDTFESILNESVLTFNGHICDENKTLKDVHCSTMGDVLKNVVNIELYREVDLGDNFKNASLKVERGKGKVLMSGLCSLAVPFNRNGSIKDAIKAIHKDAMQTFATRLKMHLESMVEEESIDEEDGDTNVIHETPRRILILKTEGSRYAFTDYLFPGEAPQEALNVAGIILNLSEEKIELYDNLEKGHHSYYETLTDIDSCPTQDLMTVPTNNNRLIYFALVALILAILAYVVKAFFI